MSLAEYNDISSHAIVLIGQRRYKEAVAKFEQALAIPVNAPDRLQIEFQAGLAYTHFIPSGMPLATLIHQPYFMRAIELMESAIMRDLEEQRGYFLSPAVYGLTSMLDGMYASTAEVFEEQRGAAAAYEYLLTKIPLVRHLPMIETKARLGKYSAATGDKEVALEWYHSASAAAPTNSPGEPALRQFIAQEIRRLSGKSSDGGGCFIATAAYGHATPAVQVLRRFRDQRLLRTRAGRLIVRAYYAMSPPVARFVARSQHRRRFVRILLVPVVRLARKAVEETAV